VVVTARIWWTKKWS